MLLSLNTYVLLSERKATIVWGTSTSSPGTAEINYHGDWDRFCLDPFFPAAIS